MKNSRKRKEKLPTVEKRFKVVMMTVKADHFLKWSLAVNLYFIVTGFVPRL